MDCAVLLEVHLNKTAFVICSKLRCHVWFLLLKVDLHQQHYPSCTIEMKQGLSLSDIYRTFPAIKPGTIISWTTVVECTIVFLTVERLFRTMKGLSPWDCIKCRHSRENWKHHSEKSWTNAEFEIHRNAVNRTLTTWNQHTLSDSS